MNRKENEIKEREKKRNKRERKKNEIKEREKKTK